MSWEQKMLSNKRMLKKKHGISVYPLKIPGDSFIFIILIVDLIEKGATHYDYLFQKLKIVLMNSVKDTLRSFNF